MLLILASVTAALALAVDPGADTPSAKIDFDRQVRPILSDTCFACHGPDEKERKADLRLDTKDGVFAALKDGSHAVMPGDPDESELVFRVESDDANTLMPPPQSGKKLTPEQVRLLRAWVEQGATWASHWAFEAPGRPEIPPVKEISWVRNPIDAFILARLEAEGLTPNGQADKETLIRRVTLDLTGLPPTTQEVDAFLADSSPEAYEKVVDRLLRSVHYGEHMARFWLDAARYGDTHGLHLDNYREMWPYRDWVVRAFNANLSFDQFIVEQLAGDMLPDSTLDQQIASGFNRAHVSTNEGGSIDEEVYVRNVDDRIDTTGTVFLGLSVGCARCHDHKYDPLRTKDYYALFAIFNSCDENPLDGNEAKYRPIVQIPTPEQSQRLAQLRDQAGTWRTQIADVVARTPYDPKTDDALTEFVERLDYVWLDDELPPGAKPQGDTAWTFVSNPDHPVASGKSSVRNQAQGLGQQVFENARPLTVGEGDTLFAYVFIDPTNPPKEIMLQWFSDGWKHRAYWGENLIDWGADNTAERKPMGPLPRSAQWVRLEVDAQAVGIKPGTKLTGLAFTQHGGTAYWDKAGAVTWTPQEGQFYDSLSAWIRAQKAAKLANLPGNLQEALKKERAARSADELKALTAYFIENGYDQARPVVTPLKAELAKTEKELKQVDESITTTLVSRERAEPRPAYLLNRGEYDQRRDPVERATPAFLPPLPPELPKNRLGFARWLVGSEHPLTARVAVNRLWLQFFGTGLVKTAEDFGAQGEPPSHPELLDWLAVDFRESGWDVKRFVKQVVMSSAYRQSAKVRPDSLAKDPQNRLLARGPRFRLDAETLRDQALFLSGLLIEKVGGPGVKPPQPAGLWEAVGFVGSNTANFVADKGNEKVHRRSLYTFWKRTSPPPQMTIVDAPSREACTVRRERTNTPLQALLLMNEPQYVEASRGLAERALREGGSNDEDRLVFLFRVATSRRPDARELSSLKALLEDVRAHYKADAEAAKQLVDGGEPMPADPAPDLAELAAWTMISNTILNLDEVVTKG
jgi:mono/diheme cytochrome c family protein